MSRNCNDYRETIPRALMEDLAQDQLQELEAHISTCRPCARERETYAETLRRLDANPDVDIPRHFFVYSTSSRAGLRSAVQSLPWVWKGSLAAGVVLTALLLIAVATKVEVRADGTSITVRLGSGPAVVDPPKAPVLDVESLKAGLVAMIAERTRREAAALVQGLKAELSRSAERRSRRDRLVLEAALTEMESRLNRQVLVATGALESNTRRVLAEYHNAGEARRQQDLNYFNERLNRLAVSGEIKSNQTDAILETLLQVALK